MCQPPILEFCHSHERIFFQFKSMLISLSTHLLLLMFELLLVDNLQYQRHMWILVFQLFL